MEEKDPCIIQSLPWLPVVWWYKETGHQQACYPDISFKSYVQKCHNHSGAKAGMFQRNYVSDIVSLEYSSLSTRMVITFLNTDIVSLEYSSLRTGMVITFLNTDIVSLEYTSLSIRMLITFLNKALKRHISSQVENCWNWHFQKRTCLLKWSHWFGIVVENKHPLWANKP